MALKAFINYVATPARDTPLNLAVARELVSLYAAWKVGTYPFSSLATFPDFLFADSRWAPQNAFFAGCADGLPWIPLEQGLVVVCLLLVAIGWRLGVTSFLSALLLAHLSGLNYLISNEKTFLLTIYFLIGLGLYRHQDVLTLDRWKTGRTIRGGDLHAALHAPQPPACPMHALRFFLVVFGLIYFFTGWAKFLGGHGSLQWAAAENIRLVIHKNALYHIHQWPAAAAALLPHDLPFAVAGGLTLLLELGFILAILLRRPITPFVAGLFVMHSGILATMHLNYLTDMAVFYAVFLPWDTWSRRLGRGGPLEVIYDDGCSFCMRTLLLFKRLDSSGRLRFSAASKIAPGYHGLSADDLTAALHVVDGRGHIHVGYAAFVALVDQIGLARPLACLMKWSPVARVGHRVYAWVARNRGNISACRR